MKKSFTLFVSLVVSIFLILILTITTCKLPDPPEAIITVIDTSGLKVAGAKVKVYCDVNGCTVIQTGKTNNVGVAQFVFDLPAILKVLAEKGTLIGEGEVKLVEDEVAYETVTIQ